MIDPNEAMGTHGRSRRLGSYTTLCVRSGQPEHVERHVERLFRDANCLGLPRPDGTRVEQCIREAAREAFETGDGIVRIEWSRNAGGEPRLTTSTRPLGPTHETWRARVSSVVHPGPEARHNTKAVDVEAYSRSRAEARRLGVDEVLLFDANGFLVEGSRSNLLVVPAQGPCLTPDPSLGPVEGLGLALLREYGSELTCARIGIDALRSAREVIAVNIVRGVVPIGELDGRAVGDGRPGPLARRLRARVPGG